MIVNDPGTRYRSDREFLPKAWTILPDRKIPRARILLPVSASEWCTPSQAQPKDAFGNQNITRFNVTARLSDGHIVWRGWFGDREDFDAFVWAFARGSLHGDRYVQRLPSPWFDPDLLDYPSLIYDFVTTAFITSGSTWSVPSDCLGISGKSGEFIDCISAGGGSVGNSSSRGGGGGAWSRITSLALTPANSVNIGVGAGVSAAAGGDSWFNATSLANAVSNGSSVSCGAQGGAGGASGAGTTNAGGAAASGVGTSKNSGGASANANDGGAGGAAGPNGNGNAGVTGNGGSGDAGSGGSGGTLSGAGGNGTEYDASHGSGGGGAGTTSTNPGGAGGNYGGGIGGGKVAGSGAPGLIVVAYVPFMFTGGVRLRAYLRR